MALLYGDPASLERLAGQIARRAGEVRAVGADVRDRTRGASWEGRAADAFRASMQDDLRRLDGAAGRLDEAARACRHQAGEVREAIAAIAAAERAVLAFLREGGEAILSLPDSGERAWLGIAEGLARRGVPW